LKLGSTAKN
jgi:hypothetical protein